ncbi:MAG: hypothetical protein AAF518_08130 [Spirochaetota bacterium]
MKKAFLCLLVTTMILVGAMSCKKDEDDTLQNLILLVLFQQQSEAQAVANAIAQHPSCTVAIAASTTSQNLVKDSTNNEAMIKATLTASQKIVFTGTNLPGELLKSSWGNVFSGDPCTTGTFTNVDSSFTITTNNLGTQLELTPSAAGDYSFEYTYSTSTLEAVSIQ